MSRDFVFQINERLCVDGDEYKVTAWVRYRNDNDRYEWTEYELTSVQTNQVRWLSIDNTYGEYALYTKYDPSSEFDEEQIFRSGFREADSGDAAAEEFAGRVNLRIGDKVHYTEYEDAEEEKIIAIEAWEDETEYSKGYYLDCKEIITLSLTEDAGSNYGMTVQDPTAVKKKRRWLWIIPIFMVVIICLLFFIVGKVKEGMPISEYLAESYAYQYKTSITSDLNQKEKADVYQTSFSVDDAVKDIIQRIKGKTEDIQQNDEDKSVAILTEKEYCFVYTDTDNLTCVQISSRLFAYGSSNEPYHSSYITSHYYRRYYYNRGYFGDAARYKKYNSGYENYSGGAGNFTSNDPYQNYSESVRQSSVNSRASSGGGLSSGK